MFLVANTVSIVILSNRYFSLLLHMHVSNYYKIYYNNRTDTLHLRPEKKQQEKGKQSTKQKKRDFLLLSNGNCSFEHCNWRYYYLAIKLLLLHISKVLLPLYYYSFTNIHLTLTYQTVSSSVLRCCTSISHPSKFSAMTWLQKLGNSINWYGKMYAIIIHKIV